MNRSKGGEPLISPTPKSVQVLGNGFQLPRSIGLVKGEETEGAVVSELQEILKSFGIEAVKVSNYDDKKPSAPVTIWLGSLKDAKQFEQSYKVEFKDLPAGLPAEGYVVSSFRGDHGKHILLSGADADGIYYAVQTFRQIVTSASGRVWMPEISINDSPAMPVRGIIEGFYGKPWTYENRLGMLDFMGKHKMNTYVYAPKDDPYHRDKWRTPYPQEELAKLGKLVNAAKAKHVDFVFTVSPGMDVCYSSDQDFQALVDKAQAMWDLGVRDYALLLDDITLQMNCEQDERNFGVSASPAASAQAHLLNRFLHEFIEKHPGAAPLITVPTEYYQSDSSPYRETFAASVNPDILVYWTGFNITPAQITSEEADRIASIFKHELLIWDNYPVTDYIPQRVLLGPLEGRDADLAEHHVHGLTANPMEHAEASKIALYTTADYTWNPGAYDPMKSWSNSLREFGGTAEDALRTFADNNQSSILRAEESPVLNARIQQYWIAFEAGDATAQMQALQAEFKKLEQLPKSLQLIGNKNFLNEMQPWILKLHHYGIAGQIALDMLAAMKAGDKELALHYRTALTEEMKRDTVDVLVPANRSSSRILNGINRERGESELIQYTPEYGNRTGTNEWGYEITVVDGKVVKEGGNNNIIPDNGYVLSLHYEKWLQENAIIGAKVSIDNGVVTISVDKGTYPVPNKKVAAQGVIDSFLGKATQMYDFWGSGGNAVQPLTSMGTWDVYVPQNMVDGDSQTYYWSNAAPRIGDYVGINLGKLTTISKIHFMMGDGQSSDYIHRGALEISTDGLSWQAIGTYIDQPEISVELPAGTQAKFIRFKAIDSQIEWVQVREWVIVQGNPQ
ncbi:hypothetical protein SD71_20970 [Cohnella kolymensis]|uniref:F5/8 type C domain-containing protein n=2 Tax=Cohnella kolymensis TaxID=1590652 RepID=A0ABR5A121_9BACL|nr:hypothetical protein SD71_20970 [Cohnella kolymensis]